MRKVLNDSNLTEHASKKITSFHSDVVREIEEAIQNNEWVVVGMAGNVFVKRARVLLDQKKVAFKYIEHGNYLSKWKERLAIKIWSGWPTFPQVFHKGRLVGGFQDLQTYLKS